LGDGRVGAEPPGRGGGIHASGAGRSATAAAWTPGRLTGAVVGVVMAATTGPTGADGRARMPVRARSRGWAGLRRWGGVAARTVLAGRPAMAHHHINRAGAPCEAGWRLGGTDDHSDKTSRARAPAARMGLPCLSPGVALSQLAGRSARGVQGLSGRAGHLPDRTTARRDSGPCAARTAGPGRAERALHRLGPCRPVAAGASRHTGTTTGRSTPSQSGRLTLPELRQAAALYCGPAGAAERAAARPQAVRPPPALPPDQVPAFSVRQDVSYRHGFVRTIRWSIVAT